MITIAIQQIYEVNKMDKTNTDLNSSNSNEMILLPYCSTCNNMMHEIEVYEAGMIYVCNCGSTGSPVFINTKRDSINKIGSCIFYNNNTFMADVDELIEVKTILEENKIREIDLKGRIREDMKRHKRIFRGDVKISCQSSGKKSVAWKDAQRYILSRYGVDMLAEIVRNCETTKESTTIAVSLGSKIKKDCQKRALAKGRNENPIVIFEL